MIPDIREKFNREFSEEKYHRFLDQLAIDFGEAPTFRVCETPVFIPSRFKEQLLEACQQISEVVCDPAFKEKATEAIKLPELLVPNEDQHSLFLQYDFGICTNEKGELIPQLIELQGFPSLYFFQHLLAKCYRKKFDIPGHLNHLLSGFNEESYIALLREVITNHHDPKNVILLEIEPEKQNTRIDFWGVQKVLGIKVLCLSKLKREGRNLYYLDDQGKKVPVYRIFNRIIFDELFRRKDLPREFNLTEDVDVEWAGHPNWFMKISKFTMPSLRSPYVPETRFLNEVKAIPEDLENYVLKPLFSFSGEGVKFHVNKNDLESVPDPENFILQRKVNYTSAIQTPDPSQPAKCEIRMMMVWKDNEPSPTIVNNLLRVTKGEMVGVKYNKDKNWVGASIGFFE